MDVGGVGVGGVDGEDSPAHEARRRVHDRVVLVEASHLRREEREQAGIFQDTLLSASSIQGLRCMCVATLCSGWPALTG
jgi:hypothetical protein